MKAEALVVGFVIVFLGGLSFGFAQNQTYAYQRLLLQSEQTSMYQHIIPMISLSAVAVGITGVGLLVYGVVAKGSKFKKELNNNVRIPAS